MKAMFTPRLRFWGLRALMASDWGGRRHCEQISQISDSYVKNIYVYIYVYMYIYIYNYACLHIVNKHQPCNKTIHAGVYIAIKPA